MRRTDAADFAMALASLERAALRGLARFLSVPRPDQLPVLGSDVAAVAPIPWALRRLLPRQDIPLLAEKKPIIVVSTTY